ncbi:MAG: tetratricopeptide repeat protein, partial [Armatimonadota bacterium]
LKELNVRLPEMYRLSGRTEEAEKMRLKLATDDPENAAEHLFWYAMCAKNRNDFQTAADRFQNVADKYPDHLMGENALMEVYGCLIMVPGKKPQAEAAFEELWNTHPGFRSEALVVKAEIHNMFTRDYAQALRCLNQLRSEYPQSQQAMRSETTLLRADTLAKNGSWAESVQCFKQLLAQSKSQDQAWGVMDRIARLYRQEGRFDSARQWYYRISSAESAPWSRRAKAAYDIAMTRSDQKDILGAVRALRAVALNYSSSEWGSRAGAKLLEIRTRDGRELGKSE